ncbi:MAG: cytochrome C, partial [Alphaproteobacteria bacterium]
MGLLEKGFKIAVFMTVLTICLITGAEAQKRVSNKFDHFQTGFPLTGGNFSVPCESCHTNGRFRGTPRACVACHNGTTAPGKSQTHVRSNSDCRTCHSITTWRKSWFNHAQITGSCANCHNGVSATGKTPNHQTTTQPCETCHTSTVTFSSAKFDHANVNQPCATCHNGSTALGKPTNHVQTSQPCETCHTSTTSFGGAKFKHDGITTGCATCHYEGGSGTPKS